MQSRQPYMGEVRGLGLLLKVEIVEDQTSSWSPEVPKC